MNNFISRALLIIVAVTTILLLTLSPTLVAACTIPSGDYSSCDFTSSTQYCACQPLSDAGCVSKYSNMSPVPSLYVTARNRCEVAVSCSPTQSFDAANNLCVEINRPIPSPPLSPTPAAGSGGLLSPNGGGNQSIPNCGPHGDLSILTDPASCKCRAGWSTDPTYVDALLPVNQRKYCTVNVSNVPAQSSSGLLSVGESVAALLSTELGGFVFFLLVSAAPLTALFVWCICRYCSCCCSSKNKNSNNRDKNATRNSLFPCARSSSSSSSGSHDDDDHGTLHKEKNNRTVQEEKCTRYKVRSGSSRNSINGHSRRSSIHSNSSSVSPSSHQRGTPAIVSIDYRDHHQHKDDKHRQHNPRSRRRGSTDPYRSHSNSGSDGEEPDMIYSTGSSSDSSTGSSVHSRLSSITSRAQRIRERETQMRQQKLKQQRHSGGNASDSDDGAASVASHRSASSNVVRHHHHHHHHQRRQQQQAAAAALSTATTTPRSSAGRNERPPLTPIRINNNNNNNTNNNSTHNLSNSAFLNRRHLDRSGELGLPSSSPASAFTPLTPKRISVTTSPVRSVRG